MDKYYGGLNGQFNFTFILRHERYRQTKRKLEELVIYFLAKNIPSSKH
jgi:hypothetical protein